MTIIDECLILKPNDMSYLPDFPGRELYVLRFSHLEESEGYGEWNRVKRGQRPTKSHIRAVYKTVRVP